GVRIGRLLWLMASACRGERRPAITSQVMASSRAACRIAGMTTTAIQPATVGDVLRDWRKRRRFSQMDLAGEAEISTRHLSFVESGRAAPSRDMLMRLAEPL